MDVLIQAKNKKTIHDLLGQIDGPKTLVFDQSVITLIDQTFTAKKGIKSEIPNICKIFYLDKIFNPAKTDCSDRIVYFVRSNSPKIQIVMNQVQTFPTPTYYVCFIPHFSLGCMKKFELNGVHESPLMFREIPTIGLVPTELVPTELVATEPDEKTPPKPNIFSMCTPIETHGPYALTENPFILYDVSYVLAKIGTFKNIHAVGKIAGKILNHTKSLGIDKSADCFDTLILIDRQCDLIAPILSQKTYGGIIAEAFDEFKPNSNDPIYAKIKHIEYFDVPGFLQKAHKQNLASGKILSDAKIGKIVLPTSELNRLAQFVLEHPTAKIQEHVGQMEKIFGLYSSFLQDYVRAESDVLVGSNQTEYFDKLISTRHINTNSNSIPDKLLHAFRLVCLVAKCGGRTEPHVKAICQEYGYKYFLMIQRLRSYGYDLTTSRADVFDGIIKTLDHTFTIQNAYEPIVPLLLNQIINKPKKTKSILKDFSIITHQNKVSAHVVVLPQTLVFVVGGITLDEVAAVRKKFPDVNIGSTNIISGTQFMQSFLYD